MTLYVLNYNNYYNRIIERKETIEEYLEKENSLVYYLENTNFNANDGVETIKELGTGNNPYNGKGNYLIVEQDNQIVSRWFIVDTHFTNKAQYKVSLRRDVIADFYKEITEDSPVFIEKGYANDGSPFVFNNENMTFNQIKKKEVLLDGELKTPWLVAYLPRYKDEKEEGDPLGKVFNTWKGEFKIEPGDPVAVYSRIEDYPYYKYSTNNSAGVPYRYVDENTELSFDLNYFRETTVGRKLQVFKNRYRITDFSCYSTDKFALPTNFDRQNFISSAWEDMYAKYETYNTFDEHGIPFNSYSGLGNLTGYRTLLNEGGKVIKIGSDLYKISVSGSSKYDLYNTAASKYDDSFGSYCWNNVWTKKLGFTSPGETKDLITYIDWDYSLPTISLTLTKITSGTVSYNFTYDHIITEETPYEIIAAPYKNITLTHGASESVGHDGKVATSWFIDMATAQGAVFDIQLLPFVGIDSADLSDYQIVRAKIGETDAAWAVKLPLASFSKIYDVPAELPIDLSDKKLSNECDLYRIVSPNGVGEFEFSPAKNNGFSQYEVDVTLLPFNPYIKINPAFSTSNNTLYGGDYNDFRGLICGGDFSLPIVTSAWETYQLQNKNYQASFDRQIESMDVKNQAQKRQDILAAVVGTLGGAASGAAVGFMAGGVPGAIIGGVSGGVASAIGGGADVVINQNLYQENRDLTIDQFGYQLQNIQARPNSLSRSTSYNINNKYFPYVEYYTCTQEEKEALKNKIKYNGMTIMAIGKIKDYINKTTEDRTYVKGQLIQFVSSAIESEDYHIINTIASEINKGVYIK